MLVANASDWPDYRNHKKKKVNQRAHGSASRFVGLIYGQRRQAIAYCGEPPDTDNVNKDNANRPIQLVVFTKTVT